MGTIIDGAMTDWDDVAEPWGSDDDLIAVSGLEQTRDDTDLGWGENPDPDDGDDRYTRDRPPHWDSA